MKRALLLSVLALAIVAMVPNTALGAMQLSTNSKVYRATMQPLNGEPVSGSMFFAETNGDLALDVHLNGLEPGMKHGMQIRGFAGATVNATVPPSSAVGTDGVLSNAEAIEYLGADRLL